MKDDEANKPLLYGAIKFRREYLEKQGANKNDRSKKPSGKNKADSKVVKYCFNCGNKDHPRVFG